MKLNMYERTPKGTTPKWIKISLIIMCALFASIILLSVVMVAIEDFFSGLIIFAILGILCFVFVVQVYNMRKAYMEIDGDTIQITDYPFFKERKKVVSAKDIHKIKCRSGGQLPLCYLVFKNQENKTLIKTYDLPEIRAYFEELGFEIT